MEATTFEHIDDMFFEYFCIRYPVIFDIGKSYTSDNHRKTTKNSSTDADSLEVETFIRFHETVSV